MKARECFPLMLINSLFSGEVKLRWTPESFENVIHDLFLGNRRAKKGSR